MVFQDSCRFPVVLKGGVLVWGHLFSQGNNTTLNVIIEGLFSLTILWYVLGMTPLHLVVSIWKDEQRVFSLERQGCHFQQETPSQLAHDWHK